VAGNERSELADLVHKIAPVDAVEERHRLDVLAWIASGAELYRYEKPDVPAKHLVAYIVLVDLAARALLLVDHRNARRWLPTGGHVEPDEDPATTVRRELQEELGIQADLVRGLSSNPLLITETTTVGRDAGHVDVSLWYVLTGAQTTPLDEDHNEFARVRWWSFAEIDTAPAGQLDPHLSRFLAKLRGDLARPINMDGTNSLPRIRQEECP
jgi:8-oxo-dGTP pyrophosphatase MutT (NUDIX family)